MREADVDGFNLVRYKSKISEIMCNLNNHLFNQAYALFPQSFQDIIDLLIPELKKRGLFWDDYAIPGGTYRENFYGEAGQKHPKTEHVASTYQWRSDKSAAESPIPQ